MRMCYINRANMINTVKGGSRLIQIDYRDPRPIYVQVRERFRELILSGVLPPDSKMPSVRELSSTLAINPNTIQRAYRELESDGCIVSVPGRGSYVCQSDAALLARRRELTERLRATAGELRAIGVTEEELIATVKEGNTHD